MGVGGAPADVSARNAPAARPAALKETAPLPARRYPLRATIIVLCLVLVPMAAAVAVAPTASACTGIPENPPCCDKLVCAPNPEPCRVGYYYLC